MRFKFTLRSLLTGILVLSLLLGLGVYAYRHGPNSDIPFDAQRWHLQSSERDRTRYRMLADLTQNHLPIGMKESDVIELLGEPGGDADREWRSWDLFDHYGRYGEIAIDIGFDSQRRIRHKYIYSE